MPPGCPKGALINSWGPNMAASGLPSDRRGVEQCLPFPASASKRSSLHTHTQNQGLETNTHTHRLTYTLAHMCPHTHPPKCTVGRCGVHGLAHTRACTEHLHTPTPTPAGEVGAPSDRHPRLQGGGTRTSMREEPFARGVVGWRQPSSMSGRMRAGRSPPVYVGGLIVQPLLHRAC